MEIKRLYNKINKSLYKPSPDNISRIMQVSHNLNQRASVLKGMSDLRRDLGNAIGEVVRSGDREPLDEVYTNLDYLINEERKKLLQETKSSKGNT